MASEVKLKCHLHDIQVHKSPLHTHSSPGGGDCADDLEDRGKYEVNGNYAFNPELVSVTGLSGRDAVCSCGHIDAMMEETASGLPRGVEGKVANGEKGHVTFSLAREEDEGVGLDSLGQRDGGKGKARGGGHCQRSKEVTDKFVSQGQGCVIDEQPTSPHLFERSMSYSNVEKSVTKDLLRQMKEALSFGQHPHVDVHQGDLHDADLPATGEADRTDVSDSEDKCHDAEKTATSESEPEHNDVSKSSEDETVVDVAQPAAVSKKLCLPRPFRFKDRKLKDSEKVTEKPPLGPSGMRGGKGKAPPPRQSWLLRLFESKLFDMSIAISYLFNSKEPGVQTYLGEC